VVQLAFEEQAIELPRDFISIRIPLTDGAGNRTETLVLAIRTLAELVARKIPTLVCCGAGMSRSPSIAAAALALAFKESPEASLKKILGQGPGDVAPGLWNEVHAVLESWESGKVDHTHGQRRSART
jgi:hypothetical protein